MESRWNLWVWLVGVVSRSWVWLVVRRYRIAGKFGGGKVWRIGHLEVLAKESLANIEDSH